MTGFSFTLPGMEQISDPRQLRGCLLRLTEELQYVLSNLGGENFSDIASMLRNTDTYMALADFESYQNAHQKIQQLYADQKKWQQMSLINIAQSGRFSSDNAIKNYANNIWNL